MRVLLIVLLSVIYGGSTFAQKNIRVRPLDIGDTIPNLAFGKIVNNKGIGQRYKDLKGKPLILDFWAIFCGPCIKELPRYTTLQRKFKDSLVILPVSELVNKENEAAVLNFFAKRTDINLPSVVEDEILGRFFPHRMIPHEVWIDKNGVVKAITKGEDLNEDNIRRFIKGEQIVFKKKNDNLDYDNNKPLLVNGNGGNDSNFLYRSLISPMLDGLPSGYSYTRTPGGSCIVTNYTMLMLYYCVYTMHRNLSNFNVKCVVMDSGSTSSMLPANYSTEGPWAWDNQEKYCYNLILPKQVSDSVFFRQYMLDDLNRFFGYQGRIEKRVLPSLVIVKNNAQDFSAIKADKDSAARIFWQDGQLSKMQNKSFDEVVNMLRIFPNTPPIINQTGYHLEKVTMDLGIDYSRNDAWNKPMDLDAVRKAFQRYGFDIVERNDLPVEVLVLSKNP